MEFTKARWKHTNNVRTRMVMRNAWATTCAQESAVGDGGCGETAVGDAISGSSGLGGSVVLLLALVP